MERGVTVRCLLSSVEKKRLGKERARDGRVKTRAGKGDTEEFRAVPMRGECGRSRYAQRAREARRLAAKDEKGRHVLVVGEPGTLKLDAAKLVHFSSDRRGSVSRMLDCGRFFRAFTTTLTVESGGAKKALDEVVRAELRAVGALTKAFDSVSPNGTLVLRDVDLLPNDARQILNEILNRESLKASRGSDHVRALMTASCATPDIIAGLDGGSLTTLRIPPLRVRRADVESEAYFMLRRVRIEEDDPVRYEISADGIRALQAHDWPGNEDELEIVLRRAVVQMRANRCKDVGRQTLHTQSPEVITRQALWPGSKLAYGGRRTGTNFRMNLFSALPWTRTLMRSELWNGKFQEKFVVPIFVLVNLGLIFGPQTRDENVFLNFFWAWWWPGILISYPFFGRIWCSFCPFMAVGTQAQNLVVKFGGRLRSWPNDALSKYGGWFLFVLFALILLWEELWNLENHARLSSMLLILITAGATVGSVFFEKRIWCRYLCPIGGMNGLFAKISATELRAEQGVCSAQCSTYGCFKGGPAVPPLGMQTDGCPVGIHPAQIEDNHDCVLCGSCVQACPHGSVRLNLRPPGIDLWTTNRERDYEVALLFLLLGAIFCHRLPEIAAKFGPLTEEAVKTTAMMTGSEGIFQSTAFHAHLIASVGTLAYPGLLAVMAHTLSRVIDADAPSRVPKTTSPVAPFVKEAYAYVPLCWLGLLAHFLELGMLEAGQVLNVASRTFGFDALASNGALPAIVADAHVVAFCQGACLLAGTGWSLVLLRYNSAKPWSRITPQACTIVFLGVQIWNLVVVD